MRRLAERARLTLARRPGPPAPHARVRGWLAFTLVAAAFVLAAGGDPYGGQEPLWRLYFETDPRMREIAGTRPVPLGEAERCEAAREILGRVGPGATVEPTRGGWGCPGNVVFVLPGTVPGAIIVTAHWDREGAGEGAVDDFSGVVVLGMLATYYRDREHRHPLVFVAFDGEEAGMVGSRRFIRESPRMPAEVLAVVNLECLGVAPPRPWAEGSSDSLEGLLGGVCRERGADCPPVSMEDVSADSVPFLESGYPAITIDGIEPEDIELLGTGWDRAAVVRGDILDATFGILVRFINELDGLSARPDPANRSSAGAETTWAEEKS